MADYHTKHDLGGGCCDEHGLRERDPHAHCDHMIATLRADLAQRDAECAALRRKLLAAERATEPARKAKRR